MKTPVAARDRGGQQNCYDEKEAIFRAALKFSKDWPNGKDIAYSLSAKYGRQAKSQNWSWCSCSTIISNLFVLQPDIPALASRTG
ncbi:MAG: hypothetical protein ERJ67_01795 [Aphanocapsa feldmannii 277cV]|uniref:Uncharacterized protein n=1 Tax=Aphanocapsa feldmannii 277cV TaxID=2507553 RepID=A0A524RQJ4_9CHRO|nr:MAG: hypothetical protein ERJ67_01795 [Aphanocapsa feldmannii 277cV]